MKHETNVAENQYFRHRFNETENEKSKSKTGMVVNDLLANNNNISL